MLVTALVVCDAYSQTITALEGGSGYLIAAEKISARVAVAGGRFSTVTVRDLAANRAITLPEAFTLRLRDGTIIPASSLGMERPLAEDVFAGGKRVCGDLLNKIPRIEMRWCLLARGHAGYVRQQLTIRAPDSDLPIAEVRLLDFADREAHVAGTVKGSPIVDSTMFFGFEHPLSWSTVDAGHAMAGITRQLPLRAGQSVTYSSVIGVAAPGQMRRNFLAYVEAESPRPYQPFLHYNSWFDLGYENRYDEAGALDRVHAFGSELVEKRHVQLDSFLFDDGWDDPNSLWGFNSGFPNGFTRVAEAAEKIHAGIGVWLSPWGGYAEQKKQRVAYGRAHGFEIVRDGYALSGPKYYDAFEKTCLEMVDRYGVNQFKFDGTGNADRVFPGSAFDSDFDAAIHLIERIRREKNGIFINLTTGTHPSPFWLFYADSIWRGGEDSDFAGEGTWRQRWITYRDEQTYRNIVQQAPLFPLNSLMLHGIIYAKQAEHLDAATGSDLADEVHSYFGGGTQLQELYITPALLTADDWDTIAGAARWSREHASILKDTHWIGGDPGNLQVYGWAAWSPEGWVITLRNPSAHAQTFALDLQTALELPTGTPQSYSVRHPFAVSEPAETISARAPKQIELKPFAVEVLEWGR
ncbi:MAG TPA: enterotoxin [Silvibacterium sp.]|nr:enterotoxin [Silvibacterium sp.]